MANLFDNDDIFHVLRNHVGDYSFWPAHATVPTGWDVVLDAVPRTEAERYVHEHWTTLTVSERVRSHRMDARQ